MAEQEGRGTGVTNALPCQAQPSALPHAHASSALRGPAVFPQLTSAPKTSVCVQNKALGDQGRQPRGKGGSVTGDLGSRVTAAFGAGVCVGSPAPRDRCGRPLSQACSLRRFPRSASRGCSGGSCWTGARRGRAPWVHRSWQHRTSKLPVPHRPRCFVATPGHKANP